MKKDEESQETSSLLRLYDPETDRCIVDVTSTTFASDRKYNLTGNYNDKIKEEALKIANSILNSYFEVCFSSYALIEDKEQWDGNICLYLADSTYKQVDCAYCTDGECPECYGDGRVPDWDGQTRCSECDGTGDCKKCTNGTNETDELIEFEYFYNPYDWVDCPVCGGDGLNCIFCFAFGDSDGHMCSSDQLCKQEDCVAGKVRKQK